MSTPRVLRSGRVVGETSDCDSALSARLESMTRRIEELEAKLEAVAASAATSAAASAATVEEPAPPAPPAAAATATDDPRAELRAKYRDPSYNPLVKYGLMEVSDFSRQIRMAMEQNKAPAEIDGKWYLQLFAASRRINTPMALRVINDCYPGCIIKHLGDDCAAVYVRCDELGIVRDGADWSLIRLIEDTRLPKQNRDQYGLYWACLYASND